MATLDIVISVGISKNRKIRKGFASTLVWALPSIIVIVSSKIINYTLHGII
jgi:hypothetical protein